MRRGPGPGDSAEQARALLEKTSANYRTGRLWTALAEDYYSVVGDEGSALQCYRSAAAAWQVARHAAVRSTGTDSAQ